MPKTIYSFQAKEAAWDGFHTLFLTGGGTLFEGMRAG